ncbi:MAG: ATP synthase F0 subunit C [Candidatus Aminicenantes bacterium]|jgi:F-type H+-transporting ATPase subunit c|nr:ATP synthase F0 subunit C [Candidatus Aminicenantes bacterium]
MRKKPLLIILALLIMASALPAQGTEQPGITSSMFFWTTLIGSLCLVVAAIVGITSQSRAFRSAADNIARNPAAADSIRGLLIIALALMESLVIYVLLIDLILFFVKWGNYTVVK